MTHRWLGPTKRLGELAAASPDSDLDAIALTTRSREGFAMTFRSFANVLGEPR
jgi:hypothetical protein